ncbi:unnamed protein product [Fusarium equiseti]|uniref:Uncharacterized protein n=1 Tax=Fusarium equiseti TaxID=61235 RepID=A0A8J2NNG0_FUSEQ|nr:unnamed protein product [Fusarium equiseti]
MPTSIPYDPSLSLMSVVTEQALDSVKEITNLQGPVDAAQDGLNSLISSKRSLTMTKTELKILGVPTDSLDKEIKKLDAAIEKAAGDYAKAKMAAEPKIEEKQKSIRSVQKQIESPVDHLRSEIKNLPLASDSMNMDVQYFSFDSNSQSSAAYSAQIASYVSGTISGVFGTKQSMEMGAAASRQVSRQISQHSIEGTLVLSVSCTHKNASVVAPFVLHMDKAIKLWNSLFPGSKLDPTSDSSMMKYAMSENQEDKEKFSIISGTTFGSSFVAMVHVLNTTDASASESMTAAAASMQASMDTGSWFAKKSGKVGVDSRFAGNVKSLLSQQNVQSHVTVLSMGATPSMVISDVFKAVDEFVKFDPEVNMANIAGIQNTPPSNQASVQSFPECARTSGQGSEMEGKPVESAMSAIAAIEDNENKVLDINVMMTALDDYLKKAAEGTSGVPINYYLKDIDQKMLAQMWAAKYYPGKFMSIKHDDTEGGGPAIEI